MLIVALIQTDLIWEQPSQNRINLEKKIQSIPSDVDIVFLPEMFTSGFTMNANLVAETMKGTTIRWMLQLAKETQIAIAGSLVIKEDNTYYNRFVFVKPNGTLKIYNKRHTFTLAGEQKVYKAGHKKIIITYKDWIICPQVCYDLRFPVWSRNVELYDVLVYVANWPKKRIEAWDTLLKARAIENMCYTIGVNRIGLDGNCYEYPGHSAAYDTLGKQISNIKPNKDCIEIVTLSKTHIIQNRKKLQFLEDRDAFNLI